MSCLKILSIINMFPTIARPFIAIVAAFAPNVCCFNALLCAIAEARFFH